MRPFAAPNRPTPQGGPTRGPRVVPVPVLPVPRGAVVAAARSYIGTPFLHQGRHKGIGVDCAGLLLGVAESLGLAHEDYPRRNYSRWPLLGHHLYDFIARQTREITAEEVNAGSILLFWIHRAHLPQHLAIVSEQGRIVHAWSDAGRVIETHVADWLPRVYARFDWEGVF